MAERPVESGGLNGQAAPVSAATTDGPSAGGLQLDSVVKRYGATTVLHGLDLEVRAGEFMTILGPSGSGKTTLLRLIGGFVSLSSGKILLAGRDVSRMTPAERGIGMVFQNYALFPHLTARQNVEYGLKMRRWPRRDRRQRAEEMLDMVGLGDKSDRLPRQLSGGQQQRVAVARALAFDPSLLLMDEPLGALDRELRMRMAGELRRLHRELGTTVVYVTHDREEALTLSDRIAVLRDGRLDSLDTPEALFAAPRSSFAASFFGGHNLLPGRVVDVGSESDTATVECFDTVVEVRSGGGLAPGDSAAVVVPMLCCVLDGGVDGLADGGPCVSLTIDDVLYMGEFTQVRGVITEGGPAGEALVIQLAGHHVNDIVPGTVRRFGIDPARCSAVRWSDDS